jgi:hypothetical protein
MKMTLMLFIQPPQFKVGDKVRAKDSCKEWRRRFKYWTVRKVEWQYNGWFCQCGPGFWVNEITLERFKE